MRMAGWYPNVPAREEGLAYPRGEHGLQGRSRNSGTGHTNAKSVDIRWRRSAMSGRVVAALALARTRAPWAGRR